MSRTVALLVGGSAILAIGFALGVMVTPIHHTEPASVVHAAPAPTLPGYVATFEAPDGTVVHKFCDGYTAIYVTPAVANQFGVGGPAIAINGLSSTISCQ